MTDNDDFDDGDFIAEKAVEIYKKGHKTGMLEERQRIKDYFTQCANERDFGKDSPNIVILTLLKIMDEAINEISMKKKEEK